MFAHVYPLIKLPRRFGVFDYCIPEHLVVQVGDVIQIPFRHRTILGVVKSITASSNEPRILEIASGSIGFSMPDIDLKRIESIASGLGQSVSSILAVAYEGLSPFSTSAESLHRQTNAATSSPRIDKETITTVHHLLERLKTDRMMNVACDDETFCVLAHALCKTITNQILIIVPRERDARIIANILSSFSPTILTGKVPPRDRNRIIRSWSKGSIRFLISTRQGALITPQSLGAVLVYQSGCSDHHSPLRNPHIHAVRAAEALAASAESICVLADVLPPPHASLPFVARDDGANAQIVDVMHKGERSPYSLISATLLAAIETAIIDHRKVLLSFNRKGVAKRIECKACGHVPFCGTCGSLPVVRIDDLLCTACGTEMWKPTTCPACGSPKIGLKSIGGAKIADDLKKAFPHAIIGHIEKGRIDRTADILLATEYFFSSVTEPFAPWGFGVVAEILGDLAFTPGDYRGAENAARQIARLRHYAKHEGAECIIQTLTRDRMQSLLGAEYVNATELNTRKTYSLPPYGVIIEFEGGTKSDLPAEIAARVIEKSEVLIAKIDKETFTRWQTLFPSIPDSIKIRVT